MKNENAGKLFIDSKGLPHNIEILKGWGCLFGWS